MGRGVFCLLDLLKIYPDNIFESIILMMIVIALKISTLCENGRIQQSEIGNAGNLLRQPPHQL